MSTSNAEIAGASGQGYFEHQLNEVLAEAVRSGRLKAAIVTSADGLPLASVEADASLEVLAGLSSLFADIARRSEELLEWPDVEEVSLVSRNGLRLVTRQMLIDDSWFMLVVVVPANQTYRRATNIAVRKLNALLGQSGRATREG